MNASHEDAQNQRKRPDLSSVAGGPSFFEKATLADATLEAARVVANNLKLDVSDQELVGMVEKANKFALKGETKFRSATEVVTNGLMDKWREQRAGIQEPQ